MKNISKDSFRYSDSFLKNLFIPGFKYTIFYRICNHLYYEKSFFLYLILPIYRHYSYKYGIDISYKCKIDYGFYIGHFSGIIIGKDVIIGKNCNISQCVTIGRKNRGGGVGSPVIGDNVYIAPGAKIIGNCKIGDNVAIGANAVVTKDLPDNSVVVGIPAKIISYDGAEGYINRKS